VGGGGILNSFSFGLPKNAATCSFADGICSSTNAEFFAASSALILSISL
jgi:hypothetical protein